MTPKDGELLDAVLRLINAIPPETRKTLDRQIADVLAHIVTEEQMAMRKNNLHN